MLKIEVDNGELMRLLKIYSQNVRKYFASKFRLVIKYFELVEEMQANSIIISNYDSLCYNIVPKVNKGLSLNVLENMLELFVIVRMFSFDRDIKGKHKVKNKKQKIGL